MLEWTTASDVPIHMYSRNGVMDGVYRVVVNVYTVFWEMQFLELW